MIKKDNEAYKTIGEVAEIVNLINPKNGSLSTHTCLLYTSPSPRDQRGSRMPSSA